MTEQPVRLGGMALANGVLVHGPTSWACAVRTDDGTLKVVAERKRLTGRRVTSPFLRGPARLVESLAFLPELKKALPEARLPYQGRGAAAAMVGGALATHLVRQSRLRETAKELIGGALSVAPALLALREGSLAAYHGAEHITIGSYEQGSSHGKEHDRCGSHLVGPLLATVTTANILAARTPARLQGAARVIAAVGSVGAATEIFGWMQRNPERRLTHVLSRPGHELQVRLSTTEPSADQLAVAEAALRACLELEQSS